MDQKSQLTEKVLEQIGLSPNPKIFRDWYRLWWQNPRPNGMNSMRLTERGLEDFETKANLKSYKINFPEPLEVVTNQFILDLERYIDGPYYVNRKYIKVFTEKMAVQLILFSGDLEKYNRAKTKSSKST